jgi:hypothetical protein
MALVQSQQFTGSGMSGNAHAAVVIYAADKERNG